MEINNKKFKDVLRQKVIMLLDSERGMQTKLAKSIGKPSSYFSEIRRGNPVNAMHLQAIGIICGGASVLEMLEIPNLDIFQSISFLDQPRAKEIISNLSIIERSDKEAYARVEGYIESSVSSLPPATKKKTA